MEVVLVALLSKAWVIKTILTLEKKGWDATFSYLILFQFYYLFIFHTVFVLQTLSYLFLFLYTTVPLLVLYHKSFAEDCHNQAGIAVKYCCYITTRESSRDQIWLVLIRPYTIFEWTKIVYLNLRINVWVIKFIFFFMSSFLRKF